MFQFDTRSGELRKNGVKLKLEGQPLQILALLLERPGEVVSREEVRQRLWSDDTFVDFEHSINAAIKRLRQVLDDSAETPRFIETLPRRGYRFIYPINGEAAAGHAGAWPYIVVGAAVVLLAALVVSMPGLRDRVPGSRVPGKTMRVAVLPLRNLSGNPEQDYFAAGMTEMLITELGRLGPLQVTSHQSVLDYAQSNKPIPQIARELGVDAVVEGTVQRAGDRVRVTVNFVQAEPENHLLAQSYEKQVRDVFQVQEEVARALAEAVQVRLPGRPPSSSPARPVAPEASDAYLRGMYLLAKGRDSDRDEAQVCFQKAIEADPSFARPYAALALLYAHGGAVRAGGGGGGRKLTRQWAEKALQLDDSLAEAHAALGWLAISDWDFPSAEREFKRAIELNPSLAIAHSWYGQLLGIMKRYPEAFAQAELVLQISPGAPEPVTHALEPYLQGGRVDEAIKQWRSVSELQPDYWAPHYFLGQAYIKKGMYREAVAEAEESVRLNERSIPSLALLGSAYARAGQREKALQLVRGLESGAETGKGSGMALARVYAALGDNDKAFAELESMYKDRRGALPFVNTYPEFEPLHDDPRYKDLLRRIGLPE